MTGPRLDLKRSVSLLSICECFPPCMAICNDESAGCRLLSSKLTVSALFNPQFSLLAFPALQVLTPSIDDTDGVPSKSALAYLHPCERTFLLDYPVYRILL